LSALPKPLKFSAKKTVLNNPQFQKKYKRNKRFYKRLQKEQAMKENILQLTEEDLNASKYNTKAVNISIHFMDKDGNNFSVKYSPNNKAIGHDFILTKEGAIHGKALNTSVKEKVEEAIAQGVAAIHVAVGSPLDFELPVSYTLVVKDGGKLIRK
jgi:hypothetical protein